MTFSTVNAYNVFATLTSFTDSTVMLHGWMIFCTKATFRLFMVNKGCMIVMLTVRILISRLRFFEISRMVGDSTNEKFTPERPLMYFFIVK
jgi:hypothetical protein